MSSLQSTSTLTTDTHADHPAVVEAHGELDLSNAARLCRAIEEASADRFAPRVVIDLSGLAFCDSTGLRALVGAVREVEVLGGNAVVVAEPEGTLDRLLTLAGLHEFLRVEHSLDAARDRLG
jgi:anti-sigma B factor antagonist